MKHHKMYHELAHLWPLVSPPEHYAEEGLWWREALRTRLGPGRHHILELGVGGGHNLSHMTAEFQATAVDISEEMVANSRRLNPGVIHHIGDMRTIRLGRSFDAVMVHDAIAYMVTEADLQATLATAIAHLGPGGLFTAAPDWFRETFPGTKVRHRIQRQGDLELTFVEYVHDPDTRDTSLESIFLFILNQGGVVRVAEDRHLTGLFPLATWERLMAEAGFQVEKTRYVEDDHADAYRLIGTVPGR